MCPRWAAARSALCSMISRRICRPSSGRPTLTGRPSTTQSRRGPSSTVSRPSWRGSTTLGSCSCQSRQSTETLWPTRTCTSMPPTPPSCRCWNTPSADSCPLHPPTTHTAPQWWKGCWTGSRAGRLRTSCWRRWTAGSSQSRTTSTAWSYAGTSAATAWRACCSTTCSHTPPSPSPTPAKSTSPPRSSPHTKCAKKTSAWALKAPTAPCLPARTARTAQRGTSSDT
mmetsp:Transcript_2826/g.6074  ORF Transcript_2826/g.6074 Transcript_2826/m.6074 type:complete len:226 (+) Transcript_2826:807-1484(+)